VLLRLLQQYPTACYAGSIVFDNQRQQPWTLRLADDCVGARWLVIDVLLHTGGDQGHANLLLLDRQTNEAEVFDPHGGMEAYYQLGEQYEELERQLQTRLGLPDLQLIRPSQYCLVGPQEYDQPAASIHEVGGYCAVWTYLYLHQRLANPDLARQDLVGALVDASRRDPALIRNYAQSMLAWRRETLLRLQNDVLAACAAARSQFVEELIRWRAAHSASAAGPLEWFAVRTAEELQRYHDDLLSFFSLVDVLERISVDHLGEAHSFDDLLETVHIYSNCVETAVNTQLRFEIINDARRLGRDTLKQRDSS